MLKKVFIGLALSISATSTLAETVYVSDMQFVAIRESINNDSRATERGIKSGTPLTVLERQDDYVKVRTPDGNQGWLPTYFITENRVSRDELVYLQEQLASAKEAKLTAEDELQQSLNSNNKLQDEVAALSAQNQKLENQLNGVSDLAQQAQEIVSSNDEADYKIESLQNQVNALLTQNKELNSSTEQRWFLIGAGTLIAGGIFGLLFPMTRRKKVSSSSW